MRVILLLLLLFPLFCLAQSNDDDARIDSLKQVIQTAEHDTIKVKAWRTWQSIISDPDLRLERNEKTETLCQKALDNSTVSLGAKEKKCYQSTLIKWDGFPFP